jgi:hypothetical protein
MRKTRRETIAHIKRRMYPAKPWVNPRDLYGRKRHEEQEAMGSGVIGKLDGVNVFIVRNVS